MRYFAPGQFSLSIHQDAEDDLDALYDTDEDGAAALDVFLQEAAQSQDLLDRFTVNNFRSYDPAHDFDIKRWQALWNTHALWRIRLFDVPGTAARHRIIYTFHPVERRYYVLGIVPREFNYDLGHPIAQRIIAAYEELDIP